MDAVKRQSFADSIVEKLKMLVRGLLPIDAGSGAILCHNNILKAIEDRSPGLAGSSMLEHLEYVLKLVKDSGTYAPRNRRDTG